MIWTLEQYTIRIFNPDSALIVIKLNAVMLSVEVPFEINDAIEIF